MDLEGTPYDFCSLTHEAGWHDLFKKDKYKGLGCVMGQKRFQDAVPSILDIQELNSKYQCGKPYVQFGACEDYI